MQTMMKAIVYEEYGPPDVLQLQEVEKPTPKDNEILVKIVATTVTPTDCAFLKAEPFAVRLMNGLRKPKRTILGGLLVGQVEAIGHAVQRFKIGDEVYGSTDVEFGAHAEYICLPEDGILTLKPMNVSYEEIVGVPESLTSLYFLRDLAQIESGQKVLVNGASGAVGSFAVQLAKHFGAIVTGVCSTKNVSLVKSLGTDHIIDYTQVDFTQTGETYDIIFDAVGKRSFSECKHALSDDGIYLTTVPSLTILGQMFWTSKFGRKKAILGFAGLNQRTENLEYVNKLIEAGTLKSVVDRCYPLEDIVDAYRYVETERKTGNVVITVANPN